MPAFGTSGCPANPGGAGQSAFNDTYLRHDQGGAVLAIDSDPAQVVDDLATQGRGLGFVGGIQCTTVRLPPGALLTCSGSLRRAQGRQVRLVSIELRYGLDHVLHTGAIALVTLEFFDAQVTSGPCDRSACSMSVPKTVPPRPHYRGLPQPPSPFDQILGSAVRLVSGSQVVMSIAGDNTTNGNELTLLAGRNMVAQAAQYVSAIAHAPFIDQIHDDGTHQDDGWEVHTWSFRGQQGPQGTVNLIRSAGTSYLAIVTIAYA